MIENLVLPKDLKKIVILNRLNNLTIVYYINLLTLFSNQPTSIINYYAMCLLLLFDIHGRFKIALSYLIKIIAGLDKYLSKKIFLRIY